MSKNNRHKIKQLTKLDNIAVDKGIHRQILLDMGLYNVHRHKVEKSDKQYSRKFKHKGREYQD
jgi:hypothetical protein